MNFHNRKEYVGNKLLELRKKMGQTQTEVAEAVGISRAALSYYEKGERSIDTDILYELAKYYGVSIDYLFGLSDKITPSRSADDVDELNQLGFSFDVIEEFWNNSDFVYLLNDIISHEKFRTFKELTFETRYSLYEDYDRKYRSFLVSHLLYEIITDIFKDWYDDNPSRPLAVKEVSKTNLDKEIKKFIYEKNILHDLLMLNEPGKMKEQFNNDEFYDFITDLLSYLFKKGIIRGWERKDVRLDYQE